MEGRIQGAFLDGQGFGRGRVNPLGNLVTVLLAAGDRPENQQLEGPLQQVGGFRLCSHKQT